MFKKAICIFFIFSFTSFHSASGSEAGGRSVYLNGVDISGAKNQVLNNVNLNVDEHGDIFISAPHYKVYEENHFLPLSSKSPKTSLPHKPLRSMSHMNEGTDSAKENTQKERADHVAKEHQKASNQNLEPFSKNKP